MASSVNTSAPLILLVDDFSDALDMYSEYLEFRGYRVATARSGAEAVALGRGADRPAIILMDLEMREMSGTEALRLLRADATLASVPILAFTAHAMVAERENAIRNGFDGVISKPCLPDQLVTVIEPFLTQNPTRPPTDKAPAQLARPESHPFGSSLFRRLSRLLTGSAAR